MWSSLLLVVVGVLVCALVVALLLLWRGRLELVEDWRGAHKLLSMWLAALTSWVLSALAENSAAGLNAWNSIPLDLRNDVPPWARVALLTLIFLGSFVAARLIRQPVLRPPPRKPEPPADGG